MIRSRRLGLACAALLLCLIPMLGPVRFSNLAIDGQLPTPGALRASVAQTPEGEQLIASSVRADSFSVPPVSAP